VGATIGVAVVGSVVNAAFRSASAAGTTVSLRPAWLVISLCGLGVFAVSLVANGARAARSRQAIASLLVDESDLVVPASDRPST
jgi:hypothetical protein